jgi:hypothetical protein
VQNCRPGACSSAGQSSCLLSSRSQVRILPGAPAKTRYFKIADRASVATICSNGCAVTLVNGAPRCPSRSTSGCGRRWRSSESTRSSTLLAPATWLARKPGRSIMSPTKKRVAAWVCMPGELPGQLGDPGARPGNGLPSATIQQVSLNSGKAFQPGPCSRLGLAPPRGCRGLGPWQTNPRSRRNVPRKCVRRLPACGMAAPNGGADQPVVWQARPSSAQSAACPSRRRAKREPRRRSRG